ncbi:MAG: TetR/AcrR family transcriptional regulator [Azospirillaceae bacterium]|nr:TetR/AcrR family transcriptional regulator [Azospirillaceae bacterium]
MSGSVSPRRGPGRPRAPEKRVAIVQTAHELFLKNGFDAVTMEAVAAAAGVSKMTLYGYFKDKEALFDVAVAQSMQNLLNEMARVHAEGGSLAEALCALGRGILALSTRPEIVSADRMLMLSRNPGLGARIYEGVATTIIGAAAEVLAEAAGRGELAIEVPREAAEDLLALWEGDMVRRMRFGIGTQPSPEQIDQWVRRKTATFLRAYAPLKGPTP